MEQVYLTRRNLKALLSKLDRVKNGESSYCTIVKNDNVHEKYPQTIESIMVTAVEDEDYYSDDRIAGKVLPADTKNL